MHRRDPFLDHIRRIPVGNNPVDSGLAVPRRLGEREGVLYPRDKPLFRQPNSANRMHLVHSWALKKGMVIVSIGYSFVNQKGDDK